MLATYLGQYAATITSGIRLVQPVVNNNGGGTQRVVTLGKVATAGKLLVSLASAADGGPDNILTPSGWNRGPTTAGSTHCAVSFWKEAAGGETGITVDLSVGQTSSVSCSEWHELDTTSPIDDSDNVTVNTDTTLTFPSVTTTIAASLLLGCIVSTSAGVGAWGNTWTNGWSRLHYSGLVTTLGHRILAATETSGSTETWTTTRNARGLILALKGYIAPAISAIAPPVSAQVI